MSVQNDQSIITLYLGNRWTPVKFILDTGSNHLWVSQYKPETSKTFRYQHAMVDMLLVTLSTVKDGALREEIVYGTSAEVSV